MSLSAIVPFPGVPVPNQTSRPPAGDATQERRYRELRCGLVRAVRSVCPPAMADRADDLVHAALLRVMKIEQREGERELSPYYLRRAAHSALIDEIRRQRRRGEVPLASGEEEGQGPALPSPQADPEQVSHGREIGAAIRGCLKRLISPRRLAVTLHLQGHTVPETAKLLGWTPKRAENLLYRGLADLRVCLKRRGIEP